MLLTTPDEIRTLQRKRYTKAKQEPACRFYALHDKLYRVAQMAVKLIIEPIFEAGFCEHSYGFRPKKSTHDAVDDIVDATEASFNSLGFSIRMSRGRQSGKSYPHVCPSAKSLKNIGKPCAGKLHARFDEGGQARACSLLYPLICSLICLVKSIG
jgi:hypothetical protein